MSRVASVHGVMFYQGATVVNGEAEHESRFSVLFTALLYDFVILHDFPPYLPALLLGVNNGYSAGGQSYHSKGDVINFVEQDLNKKQ